MAKKPTLQERQVSAFHSNASIKAMIGLPLNYAPLSFSPAQTGGSFVQNTYGKGAKVSASLSGLARPTYDFTKF
jgi:hypothetical protein